MLYSCVLRVLKIKLTRASTFAGNRSFAAGAAIFLFDRMAEPPESLVQDAGQLAAVNKTPVEYGWDGVAAASLTDD